ncbi:MAG: hypothetical protein NVSMB59_00620 [Vulcanimicrobiaceae bacterium]
MRSPFVAAGALALVIAAGCSDAPTVLTPPPPLGGGTSGNAPAPIPSGATAPPVTSPSGPSSASPATPLPTPTGPVSQCTTPSTLPGYYTSIVTQGSVVGSTYTSTRNTWSADFYTAATPAPTPSPTTTPTLGPTPAPTTTPTPRALYVYSGTYTVKSFSATPAPPATGGAQTIATTNGCAFLIATVDGQPLFAPPDNAFGSGSPNFGTTLTNQVNFATGSLVLPPFTLTSAGGMGTFTLDNATTGSVTFTSRQLISSERATTLVRTHHF